MMSKRLSVGVAVGLLAACSSDGDDGRETAPATIGLTGAGAEDGSGDGDGDGGDGDTGAGDSEDGGPGDDDADGDDDGTLWDIGGGSLVCQGKEAGIYCDGDVSVLCDGNGGEESTTTCTPEVCMDGEGCVPCLAGQMTCKGARVMSCNTTGAPFWENVATCDPSAGEYCDVSIGGCSPLTPIGGTTPTGEYYQYSSYSLAGDGFQTVCDVDAYQNRIWFVAYQGGALSVGAVDVTLVDSDGDGMLEPNQHPDYPDEAGPIEQRNFTFVTSYPISNFGAQPHTMELHATESKLYWAGPTQITEFDIATQATSQAAPAPPWLGGMTYAYLAFLGYDDLNGVWYSGNETGRRVFQYDPETSTWGYAFQYPVLAGDHMDGMEVVVDQSTNTPYVYVSDMTSNFIGQYRHDPVQGWVQENLFSYVETNGEVVEGFGYGALSHFWVGSWTQNSIYELGGGGLTDFLGPEG